MKIYLKILFLFSKFWLLFSQRKPPHIIFIYADDLGWNDVSFHGSLEIPTPNIDALAMSGILLNNYYGFNLCTPSRAAFLTGKHPIRLGLQHFVIKAGEASGLPLKEILLPQYLRKLGYKNHIVGKWHLGHMTKAYTPTYRGFDSFFGYWNGNIDYFEHTKYGKTGLTEIPQFYGYDMNNGTETVKNCVGKYTTELFTDVAQSIIREHNTSLPLFLYLAHAAPHFGNHFKPLQAPPNYVKRMKHIQNRDKRLYASMISALDDSVGQIFKVLHEKNMLENSIIVFASDNGAETHREFGAVGSNYPLRGRKSTLWEGGNRLPALIWSPIFKLQDARISMQLMHVTDWLPTFYEAAGGNVKNLKNINGESMWKALTKNIPSPRRKILYNIDPILGYSALRIGNMKIINGSSGFDSWYNNTSYNYYHSIPHKYMSKNKSIVQRLLIQSGRWIIKDSATWRKRAAVHCSPLSKKPDSCNPNNKPCLFNIVLDPCEYHNVAEQLPKVVNYMMKSIQIIGKSAVKPQSKSSDPRANPDCHNFTYVPWLEPEHYTKCDKYL